VLLLLLLQVFYIGCYLGSLLFLAFAYVVIVSRRRNHQPISGCAAAERDASLAATNELVPLSTPAASSTDELTPAHCLYLKVGLIGSFHHSYEIH